MTEKARLNVFNDLFARVFLDENIPVVEDMINIALQTKDIKITEVIPQRNKADLTARSVIFDALAIDSKGQKYAIEIQNSNEPGFEKRLGYNMAILIRMTLVRGDEHKDRLPSTLIAFTKFKPGGVSRNLPVYHIGRTYLETGERYPDEESIIIVNAQYPIDISTEIGKLVHDMLAESSEVMLLKSFKESMRERIETPEGKEKMGEVERQLRLEERMKTAMSMAGKMFNNGASIEFIRNTLPEGLDEDTKTSILEAVSSQRVSFQ